MRGADELEDEVVEVALLPPTDFGGETSPPGPELALGPPGSGGPLGIGGPICCWVWYCMP